MDYIIYSLIATTILVLGLNSILKQKATKFYLLSSIIAVLIIFYEFFKISTGFKLEGFMYVLERSFIKGYVSTALFILVMFAGALSKKWQVTKNLLRVRAEMAIIASILILPHCIVYTYKFISKLIDGKALAPFYFLSMILGLIAFLLMIPLFITSFRKIRVKMTAKKWKSLQRWSYLFYFLIYVHIMVLLLSRKVIPFGKVIIYTLVFGSYLVLKIINNIKKNKK